VAGLDERFGKDKVPLVKLPFDRGTTNFSGVVAQAKAAGVEHVVFLGIPKDAALVMREANNLGWKPQFSGHNALGDPQTFQLAGPLAEIGPRILKARTEARENNGWIMDIYLLRRGRS